jgi:hypothetical protein
LLALKTKLIKPTIVMQNTTHYKGFLITRLFPSGYYEAHLGEGFGFIKADTLQGIKKEINAFLESE